jgi:hypothetical protein
MAASAATMAASVAAMAATATAMATAIFGIHAGEATNVIGHQDRRCRQDSANCHS